MSVEMMELASSGVLEVRIDGKLTKEDYELLMPEVERLIEQRGRLDLLVDMTRFEGWGPGGFWEESKFALKHYDDVGRVAIVGSDTWNQAMAALCKPFTAGEVKYFNPDEVGVARSWVEQAPAQS